MTKLFLSIKSILQSNAWEMTELIHFPLNKRDTQKHIHRKRKREREWDDEKYDKFYYRIYEFLTYGQEIETAKV